MFSLAKLFKSFRHAKDGIFIAFSQNQNLKFHTVVAILVLLASIYFNLVYTDLIIILLIILLVFSAEMINTAIEEVVNLLVNEHKVEAKIAKDVCAAMVLVVSIGAIVVGFLVFIPYVLKGGFFFNSPF